ncbi:bifunctional phosphoglucose/phosphomannose isomerase [Patescibacteria group bacterium]|nr:MAG: bifunctional phosphoglucose/phosphomannose isomerase [Patescibacteria group bacterium]
MLDDLKYIHQKDKSDALGFVAKQPGQLTHTFGVSGVATKPKQVVFSGMGGSSLVAELAMTWPKLSVPFVISKSYDLPSFVGKDTLVICASYSGHTEETLASLDLALEVGANVAVIAHGGVLLERAEEHNLPVAVLPECPQPRTGIFYAYRALVEILIAAELVEASMLEELTGLVDSLQAACDQWLPEIPQDKNYAKQLALESMGKSMIVFAGPQMYPAAYKWKIDANENAKNTAWSNVLPEFNHNEMIGWSSHPEDKPFAVFDLLSSFEHERVLKRFQVTDRLLSGKRPKAHVVQAQGDSPLEHLLYLVLLGDFVTTYLAMLNGVDPTPVALVEKFKKELAA